MKQCTILSIVFMIGAGIGSWITISISIQNNVSKTPTKSSILKAVDKNDNTNLYKAYQTPIRITTTADSIVATDDYKQSVVRFNPRTNTITAGIGYVHNTNYSIVYSVGYQRHITKLPLSIGGSLLFGKSLLCVNLTVGYSF